MSDRHMKEFNGRLKRIDSIHRAGGGFEAAGTLGQSYYTKLHRSRGTSRWILPLALVLLTVVGVKATVHSQIGAISYDARIAALASGDAADRIGAYILQADPLTVYFAGVISGAR